MGPEIEDGPLDGPEEPDRGDRAGAGDGDPAPEPGPVPEPAHEEEGDPDDEELPEIHPEVEAEQRDDEAVLGEGDLAQAAGEAQAVDQPEAEDDREPAGPEPRREDVLECDERDGECDGRLDIPARQAEDPVGR